MLAQKRNRVCRPTFNGSNQNLNTSDETQDPLTAFIGDDDLKDPDYQLPKKKHIDNPSSVLSHAFNSEQKKMTAKDRIHKQKIKQKKWEEQHSKNHRFQTRIRSDDELRKLRSFV